MPELVALNTAHYTFAVWSKNVDESQGRLEKTLAARKKQPQQSRILLSPALNVNGQVQPSDEHTVDQLLPVFFENKLYDIEFTFDEKLKNEFKVNPPTIEHRLKSVEDSFHYSERTHSLRASIDTANNIGWFRLELVYLFEGSAYRQAFSFEVLPTKIDMATDFGMMNEIIDKEFPLWRFSLAEKSQHQVKAVKRPHSQFLLLWLTHFESLRLDLAKGLKQVVNAPHSRLVASHKTVKMDRLKGRLTPKLEQSVCQAIENRHWDKRFSLDKKVLSVDTLENRFIKSVILTSISKLTKITNQLQAKQKAPEKQRLSSSFFKQLASWQTSMRFFQRQPMFKEVGQFNGLTRESLVLQQKPGYARVYKIWQQLKWYLELLEGQNNLSLRSISQLYEIWCFLEVRRILISLGFKEKHSSKVQLINQGMDVAFSSQMRGAFKFTRDDGVNIRLAHEPEFRANGNPIKSWITNQKPDIFLEATFPDGQVIVWIFDAKYRIKKPNPDQTAKDYDEVPDDAINQMHRYRDALIHQDNSVFINRPKKTRPIYGAYALYPGYFEQNNEKNPYAEAIEEIGIGAFSLLPSADQKGSLWLTQFLEDKLGSMAPHYPVASSDKYFVEEAPRIPYQGTKVLRFDDLTIAASQLGNNRSADYVERFEQGEATHYHTRFKAFKRENIKPHIILEARYFVVGVDTKLNVERKIEYIYPILSARQVKRSDIPPEITGTNVFTDADELYWLFELGKSFVLKKPITQSWKTGFEVKLVKRESLSDVSDWDLIETRYATLQ